MGTDSLETSCSQYMSERSSEGTLDNQRPNAETYSALVLPLTCPNAIPVRLDAGIRRTLYLLAFPNCFLLSLRRSLWFRLYRDIDVCTFL
jgi:hypothetical protein